MKQEQIISINGLDIYTNGGRRVAIGNADHRVGDWVWVDGMYVFGHKSYTQNTPYVPSSCDGFFEASGDMSNLIISYNYIKNGAILWDSEPVILPIAGGYYYGGVAFTENYIHILCMSSTSIKYIKIDLVNMGKFEQVFQKADLDADNILACKVVNVANDEFIYQVFTRKDIKSNLNTFPKVSYLEFTGTNYEVKNQVDYSTIGNNLLSSIATLGNDDRVIELVAENTKSITSNVGSSSFRYWWNNGLTNITLASAGSYQCEEFESVIEKKYTANLGFYYKFDDNIGSKLSSFQATATCLYYKYDIKTVQPLSLLCSNSGSHYYAGADFVSGYIFTSPPRTQPYTSYSKYDYAFMCDQQGSTMPPAKTTTNRLFLLEVGFVYAAEVSSSGTVPNILLTQEGILNPSTGYSGNNDYFELIPGYKNLSPSGVVCYTKADLPATGSSGVFYGVGVDESYHGLATRYCYDASKGGWLLTGCFLWYNFNQVIHDHPVKYSYDIVDLRPAINDIAIDWTIQPFTVTTSVVDRKGLSAIANYPQGPIWDWTDIHNLGGGYTLCVETVTDPVEWLTTCVSTIYKDGNVITTVPDDIINPWSIGDSSTRTHYILEVKGGLILGSPSKGYVHKFADGEWTLLNEDRYGFTRFTNISTMPKGKVKQLKQKIQDLF